jgi:hypothetical protein
MVGLVYLVELVYLVDAQARDDRGGVRGKKEHEDVRGVGHGYLPQLHLLRAHAAQARQRLGEAQRRNATGHRVCLASLVRRKHAAGRRATVPDDEVGAIQQRMAAGARRVARTVEQLGKMITIHVTDSTLEATKRGTQRETGLASTVDLPPNFTQSAWRGARCASLGPVTLVWVSRCLASA